MNDPKPEEHWDALVRAARQDSPPAVDTPALLRAVRDASAGAPAGWRIDLGVVLRYRGLAPLCLAGVSAFVALATWQIWSLWQVLPWAELVLSGGGVP